MHSTHGRVNGLKQEVAASEQTNFNKLKAWISANLITIVVLTAGIITVGVSTVFAVYTGETETTTPGPAKRIKMRTHFNTNQTNIEQFQFQLDGARQKFTPSPDALLNPFYVGDLDKSVNPLRSKRRLPLISRQSSTFTGYTYYQTSCDSGDACFTDRQNFLNQMFKGIANSVRFDLEEMDVDQAEWDRIQTLVQNSIDHTYAQNLNFEGEVTLDGDVSAGPLPTGPLANEITSNIKAMDPNGAIGSFSVLEALLSEPAGRKKSVLILKMKLRVVFKKGRHNELSKEQLKVKIETVLKVSTITTADGQKVKITAITNVNISLGSLDDATDNESGEANDSTPRPLPPPVVPSACGSNWTYYANVTSKCRRYYDCKTGDYAGECQNGFMYHNVMQKCQPENTFNCSDFEEAPSFARYSSATLVGLLHNLTNEDKSLIELKICELLVTNEGFEGIPYYIQLGSFAEGMFDVTLFYKNDLIQCSDSFAECTSALNSLFNGVEYKKDSRFSIEGFDFSKESVASESEWKTVQSNRGKCIPTALTAPLTIKDKSVPKDQTNLIQNLLCDRFINANKSIGTAPLYWVFNNDSSELTVYYQFPVMACSVGDSTCDQFIEKSGLNNSPLFELDVFGNTDEVKVGGLKLTGSVPVDYKRLEEIQREKETCSQQTKQSYQRVQTKITPSPPEKELNQAMLCEEIANLAAFNFIPIYILLGLKTDTSYDAIFYYQNDVDFANDVEKVKGALARFENITVDTDKKEFDKPEPTEINETNEVETKLGECVIGQSAIAKITITPPAALDSTTDHTDAFKNLVCDMLWNSVGDGTMPYFAEFSSTPNEDKSYNLTLYYKNPLACEGADPALCKTFVTDNVNGKDLYPLGEDKYPLTFNKDGADDFAINEDGLKQSEFEAFETDLIYCETEYEKVYKKVTADVTTPVPPAIAADSATAIENGFCNALQEINSLLKPEYIAIKQITDVPPTYKASIYYEQSVQCVGDTCQDVIKDLESADKDETKVKIDIATPFPTAGLARIQETQEVKSRIDKNCQE